MTVDQVAPELDAQLSGEGSPLLVREGGPRNPYQLLGDLREYVESSHRVPCVVIDGLDEARDAADIVTTLLLEVGRWATVIVSSREIKTPRGSLLDELDPGRSRLDLGAGEGPARTRRDAHAYLVNRLSGVSREMDPNSVADLVEARLAEDTFGEPFLFARLLADHLREQPIATSQDGWEERVARSFSDVFLHEIREPDPLTHRLDVDPPSLAKAMLTALTWSYGSGFPIPEWMAVTSTLLDVVLERELDLDDVRWLLDQYGRFVIQDGEAGEAVYRFAHASLARALRRAFEPSAVQPFDPSAVPIAETLLGLYRTRLETGVPADAPGYLWTYAAAHAAAAGTQGVGLLRDLARLDESLAPDLARASLSLADALGTWGLRSEAVAPTEEAVQLYREQAATNPAYLPDLASALNNLGNRYSDNEQASSASEAAWESARQALPQEQQHVLTLLRAQTAVPGDASASRWLVQALVLADVHPAVARGLRDEARRRNAAYAAAWEATWESLVSGALPGWLSIPPAALAAADEWVNTATFEDERDFLQSHPDLLLPDHDDAVEEALTRVPDHEADRLRSLRGFAAAVGVDAAYRPLLLRGLAVRFLGSDPAEQARLFGTAVSDLRSPEVQQQLRAIVDHGAALLTAELLALDDVTIDAILSAALSPEHFTDLLAALARRPDWKTHEVAVAWAFRAGVATPDVWFHQAIAMVRHDTDHAAIRRVLEVARVAAPDHVPGWITLAAHFILSYLQVTTIIGILAEPFAEGPSGE